MLIRDYKKVHAKVILYQALGLVSLLLTFIYGILLAVSSFAIVLGVCSILAMMESQYWRTVLRRQ